MRISFTGLWLTNATRGNIFSMSFHLNLKQKHFIDRWWNRGFIYKEIYLKHIKNEY